MIDLMLNVPHLKGQIYESSFSPCCQIRKYRSVVLLQNLVTDWVEGETAFLNAFHPITPSTTDTVCILEKHPFFKCMFLENFRSNLF